jgi:hypothetical protein
MMKVLTAIGAVLHRVWAAAKSIATCIVRGLRDFTRAPLPTTAAWISAIVDGLLLLLHWTIHLPFNIASASLRWIENITLGALVRLLFRTVVVTVFLAAGAAAFLVFYPSTQVPQHEPADRVVYLGQGWGPDLGSPDRQAYYYTAQGVGWAITHMRYSWFVNLERPWGKQRFAEPKHMAAYGFIVDERPTPANPDHLPVGFTKYYDPGIRDEVLDITCAACHTGGLLTTQSDGQSVGIRIDGGQALHAFTAMSVGHFGPVMLGSLVATYVNPFKFHRFAHKVLGDKYYEAGQDALREELKSTIGTLLRTGLNEKTLKLAPIEEGFGRTDAIARIANMVFGQNLDKANFHAGDAPSSYPPVWDIWKFDWVQYSASVAQPMARNLGESLGTGAIYELSGRFGEPLPPEQRFSTSTRLDNLHELEGLLHKLRPPQWPEDLLGKIDTEKATAGGLLFVHACQGCHGPHAASPRNKAIEAPLKAAAQPHWHMKELNIYDIGTDPASALNFVRNTYDLTRTGLTTDDVKKLLRKEYAVSRDRKLACDYVPGSKLAQITGTTDICAQAGMQHNDCIRRKADYDQEIESTLDTINLKRVTVGQGLNYIGMLMRDKIYAEKKLAFAEQQTLNGFGMLDLPQVKPIYKARPLSGMWSTPPFLHNGSVPNLYQLLSPAFERQRTFFIGRREFDPVRVGLVAEPLSKGGFWFDTTKPGNLNDGHEFRAGYKAWQDGDGVQYGVVGPALTPEQRFQIIEYMKVHRDDDDAPASAPFAKVLAGMLAKVQSAMGDSERALSAEAACEFDAFFANHGEGHGVADLRTRIGALRVELGAQCASAQSSASLAKTLTGQEVCQ